MNKYTRCNEQIGKMSEIAGVEFWSPEYSSYVLLNNLIANILDVSPLDERHKPREFGTMVDDIYVDGDPPSWAAPTLGVLWIATTSVVIGAHVDIKTNYQIVDHVVTRDNYFTESHVCILHPGYSEIDLYTPCVRPDVDWVIKGMSYRGRLFSWMPNERMDCRPIPVECGGYTD